jgi:hypothetical protein
MTPRRKCTATSAALLLALTVVASDMPARAATLGSVAELSGGLLVRKVDGTVRVLAEQSVVETGDILESRAGTYATLMLSPNVRMTLGPDTTVAMDPASDADPAHTLVSIKFARGTLRVAASQTDEFALVTPAARIQVKDASLIARLSVAADPAKVGALEPAWRPRSTDSTGFAPVVYRRIAVTVPAPLGLGSLPSPGLYVQVLDGLISVANNSGSQNFTAGQFGYTPSITQPPVMIPANPGMQFTPPPSFSVASGSASGTATGKSAAVDCIVR